MWIKLRMYLCIARGRMCHRTKIWHLKDQCDNWCVWVCVSWPGHVVCCARQALPPAPQSEKPWSPCHRCHAWAPLKAPWFGAPWWWGPSALLGPHWAPPGCSCSDKQNQRWPQKKEEWLHSSHALHFSSQLSGYTELLLHPTDTHRHARLHLLTDTHTHTAGPAQCLASWVITGLRSRFTAEAAASDFQHQHQHRALQLWFTNPITSIYDWK